MSAPPRNTRISLLGHQLADLVEIEHPAAAREILAIVSQVTAPPPGDVPPEILAILAADPTPPVKPLPMPDAIVAELTERSWIFAQLGDEVLEHRVEMRLLAHVETAARAVLSDNAAHFRPSAAIDGVYDAIEELDKHRAAKAPAAKP